jgi:hypothetical protein
MVAERAVVFGLICLCLAPELAAAKVVQIGSETLIDRSTGTASTLPLDVRVTISANQQTIGDFLESLSKQAKIDFLCSMGLRANA